MAFAVVATWVAKPGEAEHVAELLGVMTEASRSEIKTLSFHAHRSIEDPNVFLMYERYAGPEGYDEHKASAAFQMHVVGNALSLLSSRTVQTFMTLD